MELLLRRFLLQAVSACILVNHIYLILYAATLFQYFEFQPIKTNGIDKWEPFTINGVQYLAAAHTRSDNKIYVFDGVQFNVLQTIATGLVRDFHHFTIGSTDYLAMAVYHDNNVYNTNSILYVFNGTAFVVFQSFPTRGGKAVNSFQDSAGSTYLAFGNFIADDHSTLQNANIYVWSNTSQFFVFFQNIPTVGAFDIEAFTIGSTQYLAIANYQNSSSNSYETTSTIWAMTSPGSQFQAFQSFATNAATSFNAFSFGGAQYLLVTNLRNDNSTDNIYSVIYIWQGTMFVYFQGILTSAAYGSTFFTIGNSYFIAIANSGIQQNVFYDTSYIYQFDATIGFFKEVASIPTQGARGVSFFAIPSFGNFLAVADFGTQATANLSTFSYIYECKMVNPNAGYFPASGHFEFLAGQASATFYIGIIDSPTPQGARYFTLQLSGLSTEQASASTNKSTTVTIISNLTTYFAQTSFVVNITEGNSIGDPVLPALTFSSKPANLVCAFTTSQPAFSINSSTCAISAASTFDYHQQNVYFFEVQAYNNATPSIFDITSVIVTINNLNNHAPVFVKPSYYANINEGWKGSLLTVLAISDNSGDSAIVQYSILSAGNEAGFFAIDPSSGLVTVKAPINKVAFPYNFNITIRATDSVYLNPLSTTVLLVVSVNDINDNAPVFTSPVYNVVVYLDTPIGTVLAILSYYDLDYALVNQQSLISISSGNVNNTFSVNQTTGELKLSAAVSAGASYSLTATVTNIASPYLSSTATVNIVVDSSNIYYPVFDQSNYNGSVSENLPAGTLVGIVSATQQSAKPYYELFFSIAAGNTDNAFTIQRNISTSNVAEVITTRPLDRETLDHYTLVISATEQGGNAKTSYANFYVSVLDVNDNPPTFNQTQFSFAVQETAAVGTVIGQITGSDKDIGANAFIVYSLSSSSSIPFTVDTNTGAIKVSGSLSYSTQSSYLFSIVGSNMPPSQLSGFALVYVNILDANNYAPSFATATSSLSISEGVSIGSTVTTFRAFDQDTGDNAVITYSITSGNVGSAFYIHPVTGQLTVVAPLDRATLPSYSLVITAADGGALPLSNTTTCSITLTNDNYHAPVFGLSSYSFAIYENTPAPVNVGAVSATTANSPGAASVITYTLLFPLSEFSINPASGVITAQSSFDYNVKSVYTFIVVASVTGAATLSSQLTFQINILNTNTHAPLIVRQFFMSLMVD